MKKIILTTLAIALAGCATDPFEACVSKAEENYNSTLAEQKRVIGNINRGYAIHTQRVPYQYIGNCYSRDNGGSYQCTRDGFRYQESPVAINIEEERRKLSLLNQLVRTDEVILNAKKTTCQLEICNQSASECNLKDYFAD